METAPPPPPLRPAPIPPTRTWDGLCASKVNRLEPRGRGVRGVHREERVAERVREHKVGGLDVAVDDAVVVARLDHLEHLDRDEREAALVDDGVGLRVDEEREAREAPGTWVRAQRRTPEVQGNMASKMGQG